MYFLQHVDTNQRQQAAGLSEDTKQDAWVIVRRKSSAGLPFQVSQNRNNQPNRVMNNKKNTSQYI